ncbi:MAG: dTMP kinase [Ilumatobacteraceae bacterium]|nr:dTMP kinase [Ilumatobacteraceae bacterium]
MTTARYIALEGLEGCGKSTHAVRLATSLDAVLTREPGGTRIGTLLRSILADTDNTDMNPRTEALLMAADRAQHFAEVIRPALDSDRHVVSDRSVYSTLAYQGFGRGLDIATLRSISEWALHGHLPDIVVFISVPTEILNERLAKRTPDRFEREGANFFSRVNDGFHTLIHTEGDWIIVDGTQSKDEVEKAIQIAVTQRLKELS